MNMVEKVARAIHAKHRNPDDNKHWFHEDPAKCELSRQLARAAIEAMREPNITMVISGENYVGRHAYVAMVDAALNGKEG